jgi:DNA polymerase-3 subunit alpha
MRGQTGLFGGVDTSDSAHAFSMPDAPPWTQSEIAEREKAAIGFYLSTHPLDTYDEVLSGIKLKNIAEFDDLRSGDVVTLAGMVSGLQIRTSKKGNRFAMFRFEDRSGGIKGVVLGENFNNLSPMLRDDEMFIAEGRIEAPEGQEPTLKVTDLKLLSEAEASRACAIEITLPSDGADEAYLESLYGILERDRGRCNVFLTITAGPASVKLHADTLNVVGSTGLQKELEAKGCGVKWEY